MATTNVPSPTFGPGGFVAPTEADILAGALTDIDTAMGGGLNPALDTPQGQLASSRAAIIGDKNDQFLHFTNMVDPAFSEGRMQDAIARIYFIERYPARSTVATVTCTGLAGTVIPVNASLQAADGNVYLCTTAGTIPASGSIDLAFACSVTGAIACPAQTFTIYQAVPGWDTAISTADGVIGQSTEKRADFELRRQTSVAKNGRGSLNAIRGAVLDLDDVLDVYAVENPRGTAQTIGGVSVGAHSVYIAVVGGEDAAVAKAIWSKKDAGADYTGNTTSIVYDPDYPDPQPAYQVKFQRPAATTIYVRVRLKNSTAVPSDAAGQVDAAILGAFAGEDGEGRARIGSTVYASRYYPPVAALGAWARIIDINVSLDGTTWADTVALNIDQVPAIAADAVSLVLV